MIMIANRTFPSVGGYLESLTNPTGRFASLIGVRAVTGTDGEPIYVSGTGRVTFRVTLGDSDYCEQYEITCFTSSATASAALNTEAHNGTVLRDEIYVFNYDQTGSYYPIVIRQMESTTADILASEQESGEIYEDRRIVVKDGLFGYADGTGEIAIEPAYVWAGDFREGRAMVAVSAPQGEGILMGLIDKKGCLVIAAEYDDLSWDESRYAYVERDGRHGCIDRMGRVVIPLEYDWTGEFSYGFAVVSRDDKYGYVDATGAMTGEGVIYADATSVNKNGTAEVTLTGGRTSSLIKLR